MRKRVKIRIIMFRLLAVLAMLLTWVSGAHSSPNDSVKVLPDSSNFVTASLLVAEPLHALYSVFGHATLRMECPTHNLDYVFTFDGKSRGECTEAFLAAKVWDGMAFAEAEPEIEWIG